MKFPPLVLNSSLIVVLALAAANNALAQAPRISGTAPQGVQPGQTVDVTIYGDALNGATELWTSFTDKLKPAADVPNNGQNPNTILFKIPVPADAPLGVHAVRIAGPGGVSNLKLLVVDDLPAVPDNNSNGTRQTAQEIKLPAAVDGRIDNLTRDFYKFTVAAAQKVTFEVLARRLGSPLDPAIYLYDEKGRELRFCDDFPGFGGDVQLVHNFESAGTYILEVRDIKFQGGGTHWYRLRAGDFPALTAPYPLAVPRGKETRIDFVGDSVADAAPVRLTLPIDTAAETVRVSTKREGGASSGFADLQVSPFDEFVEQEPNDFRTQANRITLGTQLNGRLQAPGDVDRYAFTAQQGQRFLFTAITRQRGTPADVLLRIHDANGNVVIENDDSPPNDAVIDYTFPAAGEFSLSVQDLSGRGGPEFAYRIAAETRHPGFTLAASSDELSIPLGGITSVTVTAARIDYGGPIEVSVAGLPQHVTSLPTVIGPGKNTAVLTIAAAKELPPGVLSNVRIIGKAQIGDRPVESVASLSAALKAKFSNTPVFTSAFSTTASVAAAQPTKFTLAAATPQVILGPNLSANLKLVATRTEGFVEPINFNVLLDAEGLPPGVTAALKPIEQDKAEVEITLTATDKAPLGSFTSVFNGTLQKGNDKFAALAPGITITLQPAYSLKIESGTGKLAKGGNLALKVSVQRNPAFQGAVNFSLANLPAGITAAPASIPADKSEIEIPLTAAADAQAASAANVVVNAEGVLADKKFPIPSAPFTIAIE